MRRWLGAAALVLATMLAAAGTVFARAPVAIEIHKVDEGHFLPAPGQPIFALAIGQDGRLGLDGSRGDAVHIIGISPANHSAAILNIPRDTYVDIPGRGRDKINAAFEVGGIALQSQTIEQLVGVKNSFAIITNFEGFTSMINEIGGVDVNVPFAMNDAFSGAVFPQGTIHMDGRAALAFSRNRHITDGDLRRTGHQAAVIIAALSRLHADSSPVATIRNLTILGRHTQVTGIGMADLYRLGRFALQIDPARVREVTMPAYDGFVGPASVVFAAPAAASLFADFRDDAVLQTH